jgi:hypothetical protein
MRLAEHDGLRRCLAQPACAEVLPWAFGALVVVVFVFALLCQLTAWATGPSRYYRRECCADCDAVRPLYARVRSVAVWMTLLIRAGLRGGPFPFACACRRCSGWARP